MAAKNKPANRAATADAAAQAPAGHDSVDLHLRASHHREDLLEEARSLMAAGRIREARAVEKRASQVEQLVGALETEIRSGSRRSG
jgi:hypothetical protein